MGTYNENLLTMNHDKPSDALVTLCESMMNDDKQWTYTNYMFGAGLTVVLLS